MNLLVNTLVTFASVSVALVSLKLYQWKGGKLHPSGLLVDGVFAQSEVSRDLLLALDQKWSDTRFHPIILHLQVSFPKMDMFPT